MASEVAVEAPQTILIQTRAEENDGKIKERKEITEVLTKEHASPEEGLQTNDGIIDKRGANDVRVLKGNDEDTDGECFLYPPTVKKVVCEDFQKSEMAEEVKEEEEITAKPSKDVEAKEISEEVECEQNIGELASDIEKDTQGCGEMNSIGNEETSIIETATQFIGSHQVLISKTMNGDNKEAGVVSPPESTELLEEKRCSEDVGQDSKVEEVSNSSFEEKLQNKTGDEDENSQRDIVNAEEMYTEKVDKGSEEILQSKTNSDTVVNNILHKEGQQNGVPQETTKAKHEENSAEDETRNGERDFNDSKLANADDSIEQETPKQEDTSMNESAGSHATEATEETSLSEQDKTKLVADSEDRREGGNDGQQVDDFDTTGIPQDNTTEADVKAITGISDSDVSQNENDSSLVNHSAEKEDENHDASSEIESIEDDKQETAVSLGGNVLNEEAPEINESIEFTPSESDAVEDSTEKDVNLETGEKQEEEGAASLPLEPAMIQEINNPEGLIETDMEMKASKSDLQKSEADKLGTSDEKDELIEDPPIQVDISQQTGVETTQQSLPGSNTEVNESICDEDKEHCAEENIERRDFPIEKIEELKRSTSPETTTLEQSNENLSLNESPDLSTQKPEESLVEENAAEQTSSPVAEASCTEAEEKAIILEKKADHTENSSQFDLCEESSTDKTTAEANPIPSDQAQEGPILVIHTASIEETPEPVDTLEKLDSETNKFGTEEIRDVEDQEATPAENLLTEGNNEDPDQCVPAQDNELDSEGSTSKTEDADQEATEVENKEAQTDKKEATEENIESRDFPIENIEELARSTSPDKTTTLKRSNENLSHGESPDSSTQKSEESPVDEKEGEPTSSRAAKTSCMEAEEKEMTLEKEADHTENSSQFDLSEGSSTNITAEEKPIPSDQEQEGPIHIIHSASIKETPEPVDAVEKLDSETSEFGTEGIEEQEERPAENLLPEGNNEDQDQCVPAQDNELDSEGSTTEAEDADQEATEVENKEAQTVKQEATEEIMESRDFPIGKIEELGRSTSPEESITLEQSNENVNLDETLDLSTQKSEESPMEENREELTCSPVAEEIDDTFQQLEAEENSPIRPTEIDSEDKPLGVLDNEAVPSDQEHEGAIHITHVTSTQEAPEPVDTVKEQDVQPAEHPLSEGNNGDQCESVPEQDNELDAEGSISKAENADKEATEVENKETQTIKQEATEEHFQHVVEKEILDDKEKGNGGDEDSSQQHDKKNTTESEVAEVRKDGEEAHECSKSNEIHVTNAVKYEDMVSREFEESNSGNSTGNEETIEASQSHEENTNISNDEAQLIEVQESAIIDKQLENAENDDLNNVTDGISAKENFKPADGDEKLESSTNLAPGDDNAVTSDEAKDSISGGSSILVVDYGKEKSAEHLPEQKHRNNQDLKVAGMETELRDKELQLNGETQSIKEEATGEDLQEVADDEEKLEAANEDPPQQHDQTSSTELDNTDLQKNGEAHEQSETEETQQKDEVMDEESVDQRFEENISGNDKVNQESSEVSPSQDENTESSDDRNQVTQAIEKRDENIDEEDPSNITDSVSAKENPELVDAVEKFDPKLITASCEDSLTSSEANKSETEDTQDVEDENPKSTERLLTETYNDNPGVNVTQVDNELHEERSINKSEDTDQEKFEDPSVDPSQQLDENTTYELEKVEAQKDSEDAHESGRSNDTHGTDTDKDEEILIEDSSCNNKIGNEGTIEASPIQDEKENIFTNGIQVIEVKEEAKFDEQEKMEDGNSSNIGDCVSTEENPKPAEDVEEPECGIKPAPIENDKITSPEANKSTEEVIQEEQNDNRDSSVTPELEAEESTNKGEDANQDTKELEPNEETQNITKEATDENLQQIADDEEKFVDVTVDSQQNDQSAEIDNSEVQKNAKPCEESGSEEIQGNETPQDEEFFDQRLEDTNFCCETANQESTEASPSQNGCTMISNDGNQVTEVQEEAATGRSHKSIEDEDTNNIAENVSAEENPAPVEAVVMLECSTKSDAAMEGAITSGEAEKSATEEKSTVVEIPDAKPAQRLLHEGHIEDEDSVNKEGDRSQNPEPVDVVEQLLTEEHNDNQGANVTREGNKLNDEGTINKCEDADEQLTEDQGVEETQNMKQEAAEEDFQNETDEKIGDEKDGEEARESGESSEILKRDRVKDEEIVIEGSNPANARGNEESIEACPSQDANANISTDENVPAGEQKEAKIDEQLEKIEGQKLSHIPEGASKEENLQKPEDESETTNRDVKELEVGSTENLMSRNTEAESSNIEGIDIDLTEYAAEKEADADKPADEHQNNEESQDIDKRESTEEDLQQTITQERTDCEVKPVDSNTDVSKLENERNTSMSSEECKSYEADRSDLDKEKDFINQGLEASEQSADVQKDILSQDESLEISSDQAQVVEVNKTQAKDTESETQESESLGNINNISAAQVKHVDMLISENKPEPEEVKSVLNEEQDISKETIEKEEKQGTDSAEVELDTTNTTNVEEETWSCEDHPEGNVVNTLDVCSAQQVDEDDIKDIHPEVEQHENPVVEEIKTVGLHEPEHEHGNMTSAEDNANLSEEEHKLDNNQQEAEISNCEAAEAITVKEMEDSPSSQGYEQDQLHEPSSEELEKKNEDISTTEDKQESTVGVEFPKEVKSEDKPLEKETRETQCELAVPSSAFEPPKNSQLKEELVEEARKIDESSTTEPRSLSSEFQGANAPSESGTDLESSQQTNVNEAEVLSVQHDSSSADQEQSESSERALELDVQESIQSEETDKEKHENAVNGDLIFEENQRKTNTEAHETAISDTEREEVKSMVPEMDAPEPESTKVRKDVVSQASEEENSSIREENQHGSPGDEESRQDIYSERNIQDQDECTEISNERREMVEVNDIATNETEHPAQLKNVSAEEVKYMDEPSSTEKAETANAQLKDSLHEGLIASDATDVQEEQASVKESEKAENSVTQEPSVTEENLKEEEKQMVTCYDHIPNAENTTLVKEETSSQDAHLQGNVTRALDISSTVEIEQAGYGKQFSPEVEEPAAKEAEEVISIPQLEHESRDVALAENNENQPPEKLHGDDIEREVILPDVTSSEKKCQDVEEVSAADIIATQISRAIEEEEQRQQKQKHEATELVTEMGDKTLDNQVQDDENQNDTSLEETTMGTCLPEESGREVDIQKDWQPRQVKIERADDPQMSQTQDLPSAFQGADSPSENDRNKVSKSSFQEILNEKAIEGSNKSGETSSISPQIDSISDLISEENCANSCTPTTDNNEQSLSFKKEPEIHEEEWTKPKEIDQEKHQNNISNGLMAEEKAALISETHQATIRDAASEEVADQTDIQAASQGSPDQETETQRRQKDQPAFARSLGKEEKQTIIAKNIEILDVKVQYSQQTMESFDKAEKAISEGEERSEFSNSLDSGKKEAAVRGKVSSLLDIPKTEASILVPRTPEATEERKTKILTDGSDSPTEPKNPQNAITVTESFIVEKCAINEYEKPCQLSMENQQQAPKGLQEDRLGIEGEKGEESLEIQQMENVKKHENTNIPCKSVGDTMDASLKSRRPEDTTKGAPDEHNQTGSHPSQVRSINESKENEVVSLQLQKPLQERLQRAEADKYSEGKEERNETKDRTMPMDSSRITAQTCATGGHMTEKGGQTEDTPEEKETKSEEPKTDDEKDESIDLTQEYLEREIPITAETLTQKKSHNILSGVGSKVKHSISKMKKAIACSSAAQFSQEDVIVKLNKNRKA